MTRIADTFADKKTKFVAFITAGDPDAATATDILCRLPDYGADIIELGMPFSDPVADGLAIQESYQRALRNHHKMEHTFAMVKKFRAANNRTPIILMGYFNPILHYGVEQFLATCADHGVDGLIIVDLPPEEDAEVRTPAKQHGIALIRLLSPTSDAARIKKIADHAEGFLYYVSVLGITGSRQIDVASVKQKIAEIKTHTSLPVVVGFGITNSTEAEALKNNVDGIVVGSAIVREIAQAIGNNNDKKNLTAGDKKTIADMALNRVKEISRGLR
ncbi:MAG: tryptophan synthase subunit alpha, partial [Hydrotalea sp.]|nr:tryptophan synthase subunit alpha [Hydrotalea sp.]